MTRRPAGHYQWVPNASPMRPQWVPNVSPMCPHCIPMRPESVPNASPILPHCVSNASPMRPQCVPNEFHCVPNALLGLGIVCKIQFYVKYKLSFVGRMLISSKKFAVVFWSRAKLDSIMPDRALRPIGLKIDICCRPEIAYCHEMIMVIFFELHLFTCCM